MSILTSASGSSVRRGYDYYKTNKVNNISQLNECEFEGYVEGSLSEPYYVKINTEHPRKSYCDCPHANGNTTCKHMVALYFELFPEEVEDYEDWLNSDYEEDDEYEDDYGYYDDPYEFGFNNYSIHSNFEKPLFFDEVLESFVDDLSINQLKKILLTELKCNEKRTFELYLEKNYKKYLEKDSEELTFLDKLNKKLKKLTNYYSFDYNSFDDEILSASEKKKIEQLYKNSSLSQQIDKILLDEKLAVYSDYRWIAKFYKIQKSKEEIHEYCEILQNYLNDLKHYSIKNTIPKSNILIALYIFNDYSLKELANSLLKNAKYLGYVDYVVEDSKNVLDLYTEFMKLIDKGYLKNKIYIPEILYRFVCVTEHENKEINKDHYLYSYLCLGKSEYLDMIGLFMTEDKIIKDIEKKTKDIYLLVKLYNHYHKPEKLWNLLINSTHKSLLYNNVEMLKDKYNDELFNYFESEFYNTLKEDKNRQVYHQAARNIEAIAKLNNGEELVNKIINDLKKSDYKKCLALFDEINKVINI